MVVNVYKPPGRTPLEVLQEFKRLHPEHKDAKMSYAGRLDPMAEGVLLLLIGEDVENQEEYQNLDKVYMAEILFGVSTDSFDLLGLVEEVEETAVDKGRIERAITSFKGKSEMPLPPFCSFQIKGKPLFWWARESRLDEITLPSKSVEIYEIDIIETKNLTGEALFNTAVERVQKVSGDFRQKEIVERWQSSLGSAPDISFPVVKTRVSCSSGTYIRSLADEVGKKLGVPSLLLSLNRTGVGEFELQDRPDS